VYGTNAEEQVNVVVCGVNDESCAAQLPDNAAKIRKEIGADLGLDQGSPLFGAEDQVHHPLPQVCAASLAVSGLVCRDHAAHGWRPGLHSCAASRLSNCAASNGRKM
jgi:hypothetical protein